MDPDELSLMSQARDVRLWLRYYLEYRTVSVQVKDVNGCIVNRYAAVQIPDWAVKQKLDDLDEAIKKAEEEQA